MAQQPQTVTINVPTDLTTMDVDRKPRFPIRFLMVALCFTGFNCVYLLRVNLSVAIVAMINATAQHGSSPANSTIVEQCPVVKSLITTMQPHLHAKVHGTGEFTWSEPTKAQILSAFYYGYACTQVLGAYLASRYGAYKVFGLTIFLTSLPTLLTAAAARISPWALFAVRFIEGAAEGVAYPAIHTFWSHWAPINERSRLMGVTYAGPEVGAVLGNVVGGWLTQAYGWPTVFYVFGTVGCLWCILWFSFSASRPDLSRWIGAYELKYIQKNTDHVEGTRRRLPPVPWLKFATSPPVYAICIAHFASHWNVATFATYVPSYLANTLKFTTAKSGALNALPFVILAITQIVAGFVADFLRNVGQPGPRRTTFVRRFMNGIGLFGPAIFAALVPTAGCHPVAAVIMLMLALGLSGAAHSGYQVNHVDIASEYAGYLMGLSNTCGAVGAILVPMVAGGLAGPSSQQTIKSWSAFFYLSSGIFIFAGLFYVTFASGERLPWLNDYLQTHHDRNSRKETTGTKTPKEFNLKKAELEKIKPVHIELSSKVSPLAPVINP